MARIRNFNRLSVGQYTGETGQLSEEIANNLNPFLREVTDVINGQLDFDNLAQNIVTLEISVNQQGVPNSKQFNTGINNPTGFQVINARPTNPNQGTITGQPFISFTPLGGTVVNIDKITNISSNANFILTIIVY